jgi:hypothetical protein
MPGRKSRLHPPPAPILFHSTEIAVEPLKDFADRAIVLANSGGKAALAVDRLTADRFNAAGCGTDSPGMPRS